MRTRSKNAKIPRRPPGEDFFGLACLVAASDPCSVWIVFFVGTWQQIHAQFDALAEQLGELQVDTDFQLWQGRQTVEAKLKELLEHTQHETKPTQKRAAVGLAKTGGRRQTRTPQRG